MKKNNKTLWVIVLVGALALYLFWDDLFPAATQDMPTDEIPSLPELSDKAKALSETVQMAKMPVMLQEKLVL